MEGPGENCPSLGCAALNTKGLLGIQHKGFSGKGGKRQQHSYFSLKKKKRRYYLCSFFPTSVSFPLQLCSSTFQQLLELFALPFLQLENLPKHREKEFNNEHLPKPSDLNPQRPQNVTVL